MSEEFRRGDYGSALGHLFLGNPFPATVDDPEPEQPSAPDSDFAAAVHGAPDPDDPNLRLRGKLIGSLIEATEAEKRWVEARLQEGHDIEILPRDPKSPSADFKIDGLRVELKSLDRSGKSDPDSLSSRIGARIDASARQSPDVVIDASGISEVTKETAERGIARGLGAAAKDCKSISSVTVYTSYGVVRWLKPQKN